nr:hypothetical protein [Tanacetum cinerariifolium]
MLMGMMKLLNAGDATKGDVSAAHGEVPTVTEEPSILSPTPPTQTPQPPQDLKISLQLPRRVEHLEFDKVSQAIKITKLKQWVKKLERMNKGRMIVEMDQDTDVVLNDDKEDDREVDDAVKDVHVEKSAQDQGRKAESQIIIEVVTVASETTTTASANITVVEAQVPAATLTTAPARVTAAPKEPKPFKNKQQIEQDEQYARELHAELNKNIDWDKVINHVKIKAKEDLAVKKYQALNRKPHTEAQAKKNMMLYLKNVASFKIDYFKGMSYDDIRPIFEAKFNSNVAFLLKIKEQIEEDENRALQSLNEIPAGRAAKRQKLNEEVEELKRHLQIVPNEDDDVYIEATLIARKVPVVDYQIIKLNNKPYYKIIRADDTHQLALNWLVSRVCVVYGKSVFESEKERGESCQGKTKSSYARAMIELRVDLKLIGTIVVVMPKLVGEGSICVLFGLSMSGNLFRCSNCKVFGHVLDNYPKNIRLNVVKNLKTPRQAARVVQIGPKVGFKPAKQVYKPVSDKISARTSGKKKQAWII